MFRTPVLYAQANGAVVMALLVLVTLVTTAAEARADEPSVHRRSAPFMGTEWHVTLYSDDSETANAAFQAARSTIQDIEQDLTNYDDGSELNRLCLSSPHEQPVPVGPHLWRVLKASAAISVKSGGAFDVTIGPFTKLWRRARRQGELPTPASIASCHDAVGYHFVELHEEARAARLLRANMRVDLGGIGKGYAVDEALQAISKVGIQSALVNGGGDLAVSRPPPGKAGWEVVLAGLDPNETSARHTILLSNQAIATSGDAWQYLEIDGQRYSHIVDPRTGIGTTRRMSISIVAPTCMAADGWASALCVLGRDDGLKLLAHEKRHEARIITVEDDVPREIRTAEFPVDR